jgi:hypothetical protein
MARFYAVIELPRSGAAVPALAAMYRAACLGAPRALFKRNSLTDRWELPQ